MLITCGSFKIHELPFVLPAGQNMFLSNSKLFLRIAFAVL